MYNLNTPYPSIQIYLDSRQATITKNMNTDVIFHFNDKISIPENIDILLSIQDFEIPLGLYNINTNNNKLIIDYNNGDQEEIVIDPGIYSACSLVSYFNNNILSESNLTDCFYNEAKNFIFFVSNQSFTINNSILGEIINIDETLTYEDNLYYYGSYLNLSSISNIYIHCPTLHTNNLSSFKNGKCDTIQKIPVNNHINNILVWENIHNFKTKISEKSISDIEIRLTDEYDNLIELPNNIHWTSTIQLDFIYKNKFILYNGINKIKIKKIDTTKVSPSTPLTKNIKKIESKKNKKSNNNI